MKKDGNLKTKVKEKRQKQDAEISLKGQRRICEAPTGRKNGNDKVIL